MGHAAASSALIASSAGIDPPSPNRSVDGGDVPAPASTTSPSDMRRAPVGGAACHRIDDGRKEGE